MPLTATQLNELPQTLEAICEKPRAANPDIVANVQRIHNVKASCYCDKAR